MELFLFIFLLAAGAATMSEQRISDGQERTRMAPVHSHARNELFSTAGDAGFT